MTVCEGAICALIRVAVSCTGNFDLARLLRVADALSCFGHVYRRDGSSVDLLSALYRSHCLGYMDLPT